MLAPRVSGGSGIVDAHCQGIGPILYSNRNIASVTDLTGNTGISQIMKQIVATDNASKAIGPYSQAVAHNGLVYLSGQIPLDPATNQLVEGDITVQTERVLQNVSRPSSKRPGLP